MENMQLVRVYLAESDARIQSLIKYLHDTADIKGVTIFRGIEGYGHSGVMHSSKLLYMSLDLPIVVEFFDYVEKTQPAIEHFKELLGPGHIVTWPIQAF